MDCTRDYEEYLDKEVVVLLRDGKYLYGELKSFDQFNSIALYKTVERIFYQAKYAERNLGLFVVRGENIMLIGLKNASFCHLELLNYNELSEVIRHQAEG